MLCCSFQCLVSLQVNCIQPIAVTKASLTKSVGKQVSGSLRQLESPSVYCHAPFISCAHRQVSLKQEGTRLASVLAKMDELRAKEEKNIDVWSTTVEDQVMSAVKLAQDAKALRLLLVGVQAWLGPATVTGLATDTNSYSL